jgi:hypothetical protein
VALVNYPSICPEEPVREIGMRFCAKHVPVAIKANIPLKRKAEQMLEPGIPVNHEMKVKDIHMQGNCFNSLTRTRLFMIESLLYNAFFSGSAGVLQALIGGSLDLPSEVVDGNVVDLTVAPHDGTRVKRKIQYNGKPICHRHQHHIPKQLE